MDQMPIPPLPRAHHVRCRGRLSKNGREGFVTSFARWRGEIFAFSASRHQCNATDMPVPTEQPGSHLNGCHG